MKDAHKPDHISLTSLINWLRDGRFVIPDFQREFEWKPWDIRELMRSIFLDYYIGSLLLWKGSRDSFSALSCEDIANFRGDGHPEHIVLDGQQRLTAMYYAFMAPDAPAPGRKSRFVYFIRVDSFMEENYDEAFEYNWNRSFIDLLEDDNSQYEQHLFPLAVVGRSGWALADWVKGYEAHWQDRLEQAKDSGGESEQAKCTNHVRNAHDFGAHLKEIVEQYQIAYIELDRDLEIEKVCDIFTQINSRGIRLDVFDLMNALLKPKGLQLKKLWRNAASRLEFVETERMNVYVLQVMSILKQAYCSPKYLYYLLPGEKRKIRDSDGSFRQETLVPDVDDFRKHWDEAVGALAGAIDLLRDPREFGAISSQYLPYVSILPAFSALQVRAQQLPPQQRLDAMRKIRHWYWASVFTNRYSGSVESTAARDYLDVNRWFDDDLQAPSLIADFDNRFRSLDLRRETKRGSSVYNGIFNLLVLRGARDWTTGAAPKYGDLDDHHIVPKSWGKENGLATEIDTILNRTPLSQDTNRNVIRERLPNAYLPEMIEASGEATVRQILESHFVSATALEILLRDPFGPKDFEDFLNERQRSLQEGIENLLVKERLDLDPSMRELDAQLESIEISLRALIAKELDGSIGDLPQHVRDRIEDRLRTAARKNAALDTELYSTLSGQLEYADLRELQDIVTSKTLWDRFAERFGSKEAFVKRFDHLAELRNSIRHIRTVDQVTRKEGEGALLWFEKVLPR